MATPDFNLLDLMLKIQQQAGAASLRVTAHGYQRLKTALAVRRKRNSTLFAVQLCVRHLDEDEQRVAETGGMITMEVILKARPEGQKARGQLAAMHRVVGIDVDRTQEALNKEELEIQQHSARYEAWKVCNPNATKEQAEAAGYGPEWLGDQYVERRFGERRHDERRSGGDFFAEFEKKLGIGGDAKEE